MNLYQCIPKDLRAHFSYQCIPKKLSASADILGEFAFLKNLRGRAAEHRMTDLRVSMLSAKLLVGPAAPSPVSRVQWTASREPIRDARIAPESEKRTGTQKTRLALYYTAGVNGRPVSQIVGSGSVSE